MRSGKKIMRKKNKNIQFNDLIIHETDNYSIVNKPPFIACLEDRTGIKNLLSIARDTDSNYQICHRLDKETSGIVVFAKNPDAYRHFAMQLENREVKKIYHALVHGIHDFQDFEAQDPLHTTSTKTRVDFKAGKVAFTLISTLEIFKKHTLVKCFPITGRMHQLRAHLAHHHAPIVNDLIYGGSAAFLSEIKKKYNHKKWKEENPMIHRVALHSYQVAFKDLDNKIIEIDALYPKDLAVLIKLLKKYK